MELENTNGIWFEKGGWIIAQREVGLQETLLKGKRVHLAQQKPLAHCLQRAAHSAQTFSFIQLIHFVSYFIHQWMISTSSSIIQHHLLPPIQNTEEHIKILQIHLSNSFFNNMEMFHYY